LIEKNSDLLKQMNLEKTEIKTGGASTFLIEYE
jgi:hypothetical protein